MRSLGIALALLLFALPVLADNSETISNSPGPSFDPQSPAPIFEGPRTLLWDNGPLLNFAPDQSMLQDASLGMGTYGFGDQIVNGNICADDFTVDSDWTVQSLVFFHYQTGSTLVSTINDIRAWVLDGPPDDPNSSIVWGNNTTNILTSSVFSGIYRTLESAPGATNRPIMATTCNVGFVLPPGQYWLAWQAGGTLTSGPWQPPIAIWNQCDTGDGFQYTSTGWAYVIDTNTGCNQGFPFLINGEAGGVTTGACCFDTGLCELLSEGDCMMAGGNWYGAGSVCDPNPCPITPVEESSWGRIKGLYR